MSKTSDKRTTTLKVEKFSHSSLQFVNVSVSVRIFSIFNFFDFFDFSIRQWYIDYDNDFS